ncbi:TonB-dependent receptor [Desulfoluna sp.]|uniref:TonB-dependent receptor n=1 Tax=Desulfoluna sp. TaxID=2045199 RepID=UPI00260ACFF3|nr:TonB-dependent receptor [Desulfoluna sp.]
MKKSLMIGALAAWIASTSPVWATDATLDEYVVSASRAKESVTEVAAAVTVIDAEAISNSSATDLGELLVEKGGVLVREYPGSLTSIGIRGVRTETHGNDLMGQVLILLDGRRVATGNAAKILTQNIERVEIIKGPGAVQYGSAAMGGVVNVITKTGEGKPSVFVEAKAGSYEYQEFGSGISGKSGRLDYSATVSRSEEGDYKTGAGKKYKNTGNDGILRASVNTGYELIRGHRLGLTYTLFDADKVGNPDGLEKNDLDDTKSSENNTLNFQYDGKNNSDTLSWTARYFNGTDKDTWLDPLASNPGNSMYEDGKPYTAKTKNKGAQVQVAYDGDTLGFFTGVDWLDYDITNSQYNPKHTTYENIAGFALAKAKLFDNKLVLRGGARLDHYEVAVLDPVGRNEKDDHVTPSVGAIYNVNKVIKLRVNVAEAFRMPSAKELAYEVASPYGNTVGNPDLDPEKSRTYEVGMDITKDGLKSSLTLFKSDYDDKIVTIKKGGDSTWTNLGEATISGAELELSYAFEDIFGGWELRPYATATHLLEFKDEETDKDLQYTSDTDVSAGISLTDLNGFYSDLSVSYLSSQDVVKWNPDWSKSDVTLPSVTVTNFTVSKRVLTTDKFGSLTLRGEVKNLFDEDAAYVLGYPIPGRRFFAGVTWTY